MINVVRNLVLREFLPTAWASSFSRPGIPGFSTQSAQPLICALFAALLVPSPVFAQSAQPAAAQPQTVKPLPCASADHRAFDFWIGTWDVTPAGKEESTAINRISAQHGGCVIREEYQTNGGYTGMSMSFYDTTRQRWHQTWMGADGTVLYVEGGLDENGAMVLSNANTPGYVKGSPINRVTWTPNKDGENVMSVRQHWQSSSDDGQSWTTVFDGLYTRQVE